MRRFLAAVLLSLAAASAVAGEWGQLVWQTSTDDGRAFLFEAKCWDGKPGHKAKGHTGGYVFLGCWAYDKEMGGYVVKWEDLDRPVFYRDTNPDNLVDRSEIYQGGNK